MIIRLIVFIAIFFIAWWLYRQFISFKQAKASIEDKKQTASTKDDSQESMVRCEECQILTPRSHALHDQEARPFCSAEHLKAFSKKH